MRVTPASAHIATSHWELEVAPERGGAVTALRHGGRAVLVSPNPVTEDAMGFASFVLVPYANRIANGRFDHADQHFTLPRNFGSHAHPLHGTGWKRPWTITAQLPHALELQLVHSADEHWPWPFRVRQRIELNAQSVRFALTVENKADCSAPMGVGFHPAFAAHATTRLRTELTGVWLIDSDSLPTRPASAQQVLCDLDSGAAVNRSTLVDHCFTGWSRSLSIENAGTDGEFPTVMVTASEALSFLQLYMPPGKSWFCAEPMSQMPDAIHHVAGPANTGLRHLQPGEALQVWMQISIPHAQCY